MKTCAERLSLTQQSLKARSKELEALRAEMIGLRSLLASAEKRVIELGIRNDRLETLRREVALAPDLLALAEGFPDVFGSLLRFKEER